MAACLSFPRTCTHLLLALSCLNADAAPCSHSCIQKHKEGQVLSGRTDLHATWFLWEVHFWAHPFGSSLGSVEEKKEEKAEDPAQPDGAKPAAHATMPPDERLLAPTLTWRAAGNAKLLKMVSGLLLVVVYWDVLQLV